MKVLSYILLAIIIGFYSNSIANNPNNIIHEIDLYTIEDGLSQTTVNCVIVDNKGFLWIGTQDGINKFDGYNFKVFKSDPNDPFSLSNNFINCILEDKDGFIWIGTKNGINKYDRESGKFFHLYLDIHSKLSENNIYNLYQDSEGYIWIKSERFLSRYNPYSKKIRHYEHFNNIFNISPENETFSIFEDHKGLLWVGTKDGLNYFDRRLEIFKRYRHKSNKPNSISNNFIKAIFEDHKKNLWIGTSKGLNRFNRKTETFERYSIYEKSDFINDIFEDNDGSLWVATQKGLSLYNHHDNSFTLVNQFVHHEKNLGTTSISSLVEDNSGNLWAGTYLGLMKIQRNSKKFNLYNTDNKGNSLFVLSIYKESNYIYIGTWGNGLYILDENTNEFTQYKSSNSNLKNNFIHKIFPYSKNTLWLGTQSGISVFDKRTKRFKEIRNQKLRNRLQNNRVYEIIRDSNKDIWVAAKLGLYKATKDSLYRYFYNPNKPNSISSSHIYDLLEDKNNNLWIATNNGLNYLNTKTNEIKCFIRNNESLNNTLSNNKVINLYQDTKNNYLWIGTVSGLNRLNLTTHELKFFTEKDGLPNNIIYAILQDEKENLWMSTNKGLSKYDIHENEFFNFGIKDGLQDYEFNLGAYYKDKDGKMFFGGISGFNFFYPDSIEKNKIVPNIEITSVSVLVDNNNNEYNINKERLIKIPYNSNLISIEFAALDYTHSSKNRYAYKLEGLEDKWIELGNRRYASFSNLPPGKYTFRVKGSNSDNIWNEEGTYLNIIVITPFWLTHIAYILYAIVILGLIFISFRYRTRSLRKTNQELTEKQLIALQVAKQKEALTIQNKNITDSIIYAKRIQEALMPSLKLFNKILPESFILHKAKDIVSGDFYWINEHNNKIFIAVVDCTGHGVPGAFMSIIGFELLRNITDDQGIECADEILHLLNKGVATTFKQSSDNIRLKDGMDIALCVIDKGEKTLEFAGAFRPLYFIRENKIEEIKGNRFSVGLMDDEIPEGIEKTTINLKKDDIFYIFSDGYADQFGGSEGKKYKYRRYRHLLLTIHKLPLEQQKIYLEQSFDDWKGSLEQVDDVLIVGFKPNL